MADEAEKQVIYQPKKMYNTMLKKQYHDTAASYFDDLCAKSGVNKEENALLLKKLAKSQDEYNVALKAYNKIKGAKNTVMAFGIVFLVAAIIGIFVAMSGSDNSWIGWIVFGVGLALGIALLVIQSVAFKKKLAPAKEALGKAKGKKDELIEACYKNTAPLNDALDWGAPQEIMEKATPIIDLDPVFMGDRLEALMEKFGFEEITDPYSSVLEVLSGQIQGNPFVLEKTLDCRIYDKRYEGTLTIHWTTTSRDSQGRVQVNHHTQTLHAYATHPAPGYATETRLVYGSEAAPHLKFTRTPVHAEKMNDKERERFVKNRIKKLDKKEAKDLGNISQNFTKLGDDEFDALFGAYDRNNEVEFRLLYTPLAIKNTLDLMENPEPYGDDFSMVKHNMITIVKSEHSQKFDYSSSPTNFMGYDLSKMKEDFVKYCDDFIKNLFFDLAPILSVPLYQIHKPFEYIFKTPYRSNFSSFEQETLANGLDPMLFIPDEAGSDLPLILKAEAASRRGGKGDHVRVNAMSFKETPMVDYVSVLGGDGCFHSVPVHWIRYDEVHKVSNIGISKVGGSRKAYLDGKDSDFGGCGIRGAWTHFERGLLAVFEGNEEFLEDINNTLVEYFVDK
ncbi:MAG: DUF4231 domain-containing protein [Bacilli bacterium]|nr:DUF4231 domain-containing protein [Bacilli bacterium]